MGLACPGVAASAFDHRLVGHSLLAVSLAPDPRADAHAEQVLSALAPPNNGRVWPNFAPPHDFESSFSGVRPAVLVRLVEGVAA